MVPDTRPAGEITADVHAVARRGRRTAVVRGIDRFTHTADREPAAMVWIASLSGLGTHRTVLVPLTNITIRPGRTR